MLWVLLACALFMREAYPCSVALNKMSNVDIVNKADAIVRATATEYATPPSDPRIRTTGTPDSKIRFKVVETIRGPVVPDLILPGYLVDRDDFNDQASPYSVVRPNGRSGSCFANSCRSGVQVLLFLKKTKSRELTVNWYALGPVNEQLHSDHDPWLLWVREQAHKADTAPKTDPKRSDGK